MATVSCIGNHIHVASRSIRPSVSIRSIQHARFQLCSTLRNDKINSDIGFESSLFDLNNNTNNKTSIINCGNNRKTSITMNNYIGNFQHSRHKNNNFNKIIHTNKRLIHLSNKLNSDQEKEELVTSTITTTTTTESSYNPKILNLVEQISQLNLLEVSEFVKCLKEKLNLPDNAMMGSMGSTPMMMDPSQMAAMAAAGNNGGVAQEEEEPQQEQTIFEVVLKSYPDDKKVSIIKEVRAIWQLGLKEAKQMVEKAPVTLASNCPKVDAESFVERLTKTGAEVVLE